MVAQHIKLFHFVAIFALNQISDLYPVLSPPLILSAPLKLPLISRDPASEGNKGFQIM